MKTKTTMNWSREPEHDDLLKSRATKPMTYLL